MSLQSDKGISALGYRLTRELVCVCVNSVTEALAGATLSRNRGCQQTLVNTSPFPKLVQPVHRHHGWGFGRKREGSLHAGLHHGSNEEPGENNQYQGFCWVLQRQIFPERLLVAFTSIWRYSPPSSRVIAPLSHVNLNEWLAFYSAFLNTHRSGVLTVLFGCYMADASWNCCLLGAFCAHHTTMHHVTSRQAKSHAVTRHLRFRHNDRDLTCATAVIWERRGWNGYQNKSQHKGDDLDPWLSVVLTGEGDDGSWLCLLPLQVKEMMIHDCVCCLYRWRRWWFMTVSVVLTGEGDNDSWLCLLSFTAEWNDDDPRLSVVLTDGWNEDGPWLCLLSFKCGETDDVPVVVVHMLKKWL